MWNEQNTNNPISIWSAFVNTVEISVLATQKLRCRQLEE